MSEYSPPKTTELTLERTIAASPAEVYDVWLDPTSPGGPWFGCAKVVLDAKVDGLFYSAIVHAGREWAHYGRFVELDRPRRIVHTWVSEGTRGLESRVSLDFEPAPEGQTRVVLRHAGVPDDPFGLQHGEGWAFVLGAIEERFRSLTTSRLLDAPPERVFAAWTDPVRLARWWGPKDFRNTFEVCEPRTGGAWRYTMHGPDGRDFRNESVFAMVVPPSLVVLEHRSKPHYKLTAVLAPEGGRTRLTWIQTFETAEVCEGMRPLVTEPNEQNLDRLAEELLRA